MTILSPWGELPAVPVYLVVAFLGACFGSFANVLIYRLPAEVSLIKPPSRCPHCEKDIAWYDNIPVVSWLMLRAKCRHCKAPISIQYPLIEAVSAGLAVLAVWKFGLSYSGMAHGLLFIGLLSLIIIDLRHWLLPFAITIPLTVIALIGSAFFDMLPLKVSLIGAGVGFGVFLLLMLGGQWILKKEAMGGGDVVFGAMAGSFVGWQLVLLMMFVASALGTLLALFLLLLRKDVVGRSIPFGPFLAIALVICLFWGHYAIEWYIGFLGGPQALTF
ncbi:MAG: prepilin peptidase [Calditrichaeota bacterium]|nr:prepilin peptidase [Calditrichota bacterium]